MLIELNLIVAMIAILATAAVPVAIFQVKRTKERELRRDLWEMRRVIAAYKDLADRGGIQTKVDSLNHPLDLETLVEGVDIQARDVRFLRLIPIDLMTGTQDWGCDRTTTIPIPIASAVKISLMCIRRAMQPSWTVPSKTLGSCAEITVKMAGCIRSHLDPSDDTMLNLKIV